MIIDIHTHICPDRIAKVVEEISSRRFGTLYGSMTLNALLLSMEECNIDISVVFNIAERPEVVKPANDFIIKVSDNKKIIGFGTIHPDFEDYKAEIKRLKTNNIKGVKFHSLIQGFFVDEPRMLRIYEELEKEDIICIFHCGKDPADPLSPPKTSPQKLAKVLNIFPKLKVIAAHFGGLYMLEEVREYLVGRNLYFDTSWTPSLKVLDPLQITEIIKNHGSNKILFGTDYPFTPRKEQINWIKELPLNEEDKQRILWINAQQLFNLSV